MAATKTSADQAKRWGEQAEVFTTKVPHLTELHAADMIGVLKDDISKCKTILEVGCGAGAFLQSYIKIYPNGIPGQTFILSDLAPGLIEKTKEMVKVPEDYATTFVFQVEDGTQLSGIDDDSVDLLVSNFGLFLIPDQEAALAAARRVVRKDGGILANTSWMFHEPKALKETGFGANLQGAFEVATKAARPDFDQKNLYKWADGDSIKEMLAPMYETVKLTRAVHTGMWEFDVFWNMLLNNPVSDLKSASEEDAEKAKGTLIDYIGQDIAKPISMWSASIICVARSATK